MCEIQSRNDTAVTAIVHEGPFDLSSGNYWFYFFDENFNLTQTWAA